MPDAAGVRPSGRRRRPDRPRRRGEREANGLVDDCSARHKVVIKEHQEPTSARIDGLVRRQWLITGRRTRGAGAHRTRQRSSGWRSALRAQALPPPDHPEKRTMGHRAVPARRLAPAKQTVPGVPRRRRLKEEFGVDIRNGAESGLLRDHARCRAHAAGHAAAVNLHPARSVAIVDLRTKFQSTAQRSTTSRSSSSVVRERVVGLVVDAVSGRLTRRHAIVQATPEFSNRMDTRLSGHGPRGRS